MSLHFTSIPLTNLPLRPSTLEFLQKRGFTNTSEVARSRQDGGLANFAAELGCTLRQATDYFREIQGCLALTSPSGGGVTTPSSSSGIQALTASQILNQTSNSNNHHHPTRTRNVVTFCRSIDQLLGGGVALGEVTEIAGSPGVGKTQLCHQLSVDARLPVDYGGAAGETVYVDTEGNFSPERCYTMAHALVDHVRKSAERKRRMAQSTLRPPPPPVPEWFEPDTILKGIHVYRVHDEAAQTAVLMALPEFLRERAKSGNPVKLVVVDSIAFHYRCAPPGGNYMARTRSLSTVASLLSDIATTFDVAVVVINQMTTKFGGNGSSAESSQQQSSRLVPALGESWAHATTTRLVLSSSSSNHSSSHHSNTTTTNSQMHRTCKLVKSPHKPCGVATYKVLECGIRDCDTPDTTNSRMVSAHRMDSSATTTTTTTHNKRIRTH